MRKIMYLAFVFLFLSLPALAQSDFRPGYIITNALDTVYGKIDYRGDLLMGAVCRFTENEESTPLEYFPGDLYGFRFISSKYYVSREVTINSTQKMYFLEFLIKGKMSVFYLRNDNGDHYFVETEEDELVVLPYKEKIHREESKQYLSSSRQHIGILNYMVRDAPATRSLVHLLKKPDHKSLINLAEKYQYEVCREEDCVIYERQIPFLKVAVEPLFGFVKYNGNSGLVSEYGAHLLFWLPRGNEKLYFKTGGLYSSYTAGRNFYRIFKFPLQLQYLHPNKTFKPKLSLGLNFYRGSVNTFTDFVHSLHLGTGFNYRISERLYLSTNISSEFSPPFSGIPKEGKDASLFKTAAYSFNSGIYFQL